MKWIDFKNKVEKLGFNEDTEIRLFVSTYDGDTYDLKVEDVEDNDRQNGYDDAIDVFLSDPPKEYRDYFNESYIDEMINELNQVIQKYR